MAGEGVGRGRRDALLGGYIVIMGSAHASWKRRQLACQDGQGGDLAIVSRLTAAGHEDLERDDRRLQQRARRTWRSRDGDSSRIARSSSGKRNRT